jgi:hypothetical protein
MTMKSVTSALILLVLLGGLTPTRTCSAQALPDSLVERIRAGAARLVLPGDSVGIPLLGTPPLPFVEVGINGTGPYRFLIDLGSNVTLLRRDVVDASRSTVLVERSTTDIVHVEAIALGEARLEGVTVASYDELDVDGVLGYNVLQYSSFTLDFPGKRLILHRDSLPPSDGRTVFSYELVGRMPYIRVCLGLDSLLVNLNTGATEWMTVPPSWQSRFQWGVAPVPGRTTFNNQTGSAQVLEGRLADTLRFGELTIPTPLVYVNPDAEDAWLGAAAMAGVVWTFAPRQRRVQVRAAVRDR